MSPVSTLCMDLWHVYSWTNGCGKLEYVPSLGGNITYSIKDSYLIFIRVGQWQWCWYERQMIQNSFSFSENSQEVHLMLGWAGYDDSRLALSHLKTTPQRKWRMNWTIKKKKSELSWRIIPVAVFIITPLPGLSTHAGSIQSFFIASTQIKLAFWLKNGKTDMTLSVCFGWWPGDQVCHLRSACQGYN